MSSSFCLTSVLAGDMEKASALSLQAGNKGVEDMWESLDMEASKEDGEANIQMIEELGLFNKNAGRC